MKNLSTLFGFAALIAAIGFSTAACDDGGGGRGNSGEGNASGMETLSLSGGVYLLNPNPYTGVSYSSFTGGNLTVDDYGLGGSGTVTNGNLSYSVGTPDYLYTLDQEEFEDLEDVFSGYDIHLSRATVQGSIFFTLGIIDADGELGKYSYTYNVSNNSTTYTRDGVFYIYVDNDITITGTGWNAIHQKMEESATFTGTAENPASWTSTSTITVSLGNPSLRWILFGYVPPATIPPANHTPLSFNTWANGSITGSVREQYFSFTATANEHYIHFRPGTLDDVNVYVYHSSGSMVGDSEHFYDSWPSSSCSWDLTSGQLYYVRVLPYFSNDSGAYEIAFNSTSAAPLSASLPGDPSFSVVGADTVLEKPQKNIYGFPGLQTLHRTSLNRLPFIQK